MTDEDKVSNKNIFIKSNNGILVILYNIDALPVYISKKNIKFI